MVTIVRTLKKNLRPYYTELNRVITGKQRVISKYDYHVIGDAKYNCFFGYYDCSPFCPTEENLVIYISGNDNRKKALVHLYNIKTKTDLTIGETNCWNWQQGCRLRWLTNESRHLILNDFDGYSYFSKVINSKGNTICRFPWPLYDVDSSFRLGATTNFTKLGYLRPGYGYTLTPFQKDKISDAVISIVDLQAKEVIKEISYKQILDLFGQTVLCSDNYYVNHLSFSPDGSKILFFIIKIEKGFHHASLCVYDLKCSKLFLLESEMKVSHYVWEDNNTIICTAYDKKYKCRYYRYSCYSYGGLLIENSALCQDGHPRMFKSGKMLTDTYPDKNGYQKLFVTDLESGKAQTISLLYSTPFMAGEKRTDLHPRISPSESLICVDSNNKGKRQLIIFEYE